MGHDAAAVIVNEGRRVAAQRSGGCQPYDLWILAFAEMTRSVNPRAHSNILLSSFPTSALRFTQR
jgi:hypothetical protein